MIDSRELRLRAADAPLISMDADGRAMGPLPDDVRVPSLLVAPVSEAVKRVVSGMVAEDLDRSLIWVVRGIAVGRAVVEALPDGSFTMAQLIDEVTAAGHTWDTTLL
jgi:hypothetical protein